MTFSHELQVELGRCLGVDLLEELDPLLMPMPQHALGNDSALCKLDCLKQRRHPVAFVVNPFASSIAPDRRLGSFHRTTRPVRDQASSNTSPHSHQLFDEARGVGDLEALRTMRL